MCFEFRRDDVAAETQRRQAIKKEEKEQQQAKDEADALEIVPILEQAIAGMDFRTETLTLTGYTDNAVKIACDLMMTEGHTFAGYTYHASWRTTDYRLKAESGGVVTLTNSKWDRAELQKYKDLIEEAIDSGAFQVEFQPADYPDQDGDNYAAEAYRLMKAESYVTASGKASGVDYLLFSGGTNKDSGVFTADLRYPLPEMTDEEALAYYTGVLEQTIREGRAELTIQHTWDSLNYQKVLMEAVNAVGGKGYAVDELVCGQDYTLLRRSTSSSGITAVEIRYLAED